MVAWTGGVLVGLEPVVAREYHVPFGMRSSRCGQLVGCRFRT
jgi:hypothetical protein